ncbi:hypothetical protein N665_0198s0260 [Sinapis alba]|nr:hypothetical protein N665_0198s0260 [Sinapis alba]
MTSPLRQLYISSSPKTALLLVGGAMAARWRTSKLGLVMVVEEAKRRRQTRWWRLGLFFFRFCFKTGFYL